MPNAPGMRDPVIVTACEAASLVIACWTCVEQRRTTSLACSSSRTNASGSGRGESAGNVDPGRLDVGGNELAIDQVLHVETDRERALRDPGRGRPTEQVEDPAEDALGQLSHAIRQSL